MGKTHSCFSKTKRLYARRFCKRTRVSVSVLGEVERGNRSPSQDFVVEVAKALKISIDELMPK